MAKAKKVQGFTSSFIFVSVQIILFFLIAITTHTALAQSGVFIQPSLGLGFSGTTQVGNTAATYATSAYNYKIEVGRNLEKIRLTAGLQYLRSGSALDVSYYDSGKVLQTYTDYRYFYHISITIKVAYPISCTQKLALIPAAGLTPSYNLSEKDIISYVDRDITNTLSRGQFQNYFHSISLWAAASCNAEYHMYPRLSAFMGLEYEYMFTNISKVRSPAGYFSDKQFNHVFLLNAGLKWDFVKKKKRSVADQHQPGAGH